MVPERHGCVRDTALIFTLFFVAAASPPPDVNEVHYLSMARHHWDPTWCPGDAFLDSTAAHGAFYSLFGWLTRWLSLTATAWLGRILTWLALAWAWQRLSRALRWRTLETVAAAALFVTLQRWGQMAGEWILGGFEAKGLAYALVILALESLVRARWNRVWVLLGLAAAFHVLVGGWAMVAAVLAYAWSRSERPNVASMLPALACSFLLSLLGLLPALWLNWQVDAETVRQANRIYVFERLPHHLLLHRFSPYLIARHAVLLAATVWLVRSRSWNDSQQRLMRLVFGAVAIACGGLLLELVTIRHPDWAASLLRFYWFRLSDVMLPLGATVVAVVFLREEMQSRPRVALGLTSLAVVLVAVDFGQLVWHRYRDPRPRAVAQSMPTDESLARRRHRYQEWQRVCAWIAENTQPDAVLLTPRYQQSLRWYAERAEVVNWKDVPQDARGIVEWWRRMTDIYPRSLVWQGLVGHGESGLQDLARRYDFDHVLLDRTRSKMPLGFPRLFPPPGEDCLYEVYLVP